MYNRQLLDHVHNPRNRGVIPNPDFETGQVNPSCGDAVSLTGTISQDRIKKLMFTGHGCMISQAAASLLTELVVDMPLALVFQLTAEDMQKLIGMQLGPNRIKCVLLSLHALQEGISPRMHDLVRSKDV